MTQPVAAAAVVIGGLLLVAGLVGASGLVRRGRLGDVSGWILVPVGAALVGAALIALILRALVEHR